ncbi:helix-turn-helix domain-containing protein [bacterium]|nr:helix-turn-helix domain-containing protein [bacterium]
MGVSPMSQAPTALAIRPREAAKMLGVSERTLFTWTRDGIIPAAKIGRTVLYSVDHLRAWIDKQAGASAAERAG